MEKSETLDFSDLKQKAKQLFRKGFVQKSIRVMEDEMIQKSRDLNDNYNLIRSLILIARIQLEIGQFPKSEASLNEAMELLKENEGAEQNVHNED